MKYGVVYYKDTDNIGDDIQNYAAMRFLPQLDYLIDREQLSEFHSNGNEKVAVIFNGWFLHNKFNWPPSGDIYPLCVSMHFSKNDYMGIGYDFLDGIGGAYLKQYQPIGCRDTNTLCALKRKGIEGYLSGCMTLTLKKRTKKEDTDSYICLVDVPEPVKEKVLAEAEKKGIKCRFITHWVNYKEEQPDWEERMQRVEALLDIYQNARCVITKRLHCALPCLALGTPVLLLLNESEDDVTRYSHFIDFLHVCSREAFLEGRADFDFIHPPENSCDFLQEKEQLILRAEQFIAEAAKRCNEYGKQFTDDNRNVWQRNMLIRSVLHTSSEIDRLLKEKAAVEKKAFEDICSLSGQYEKDMDTLNEYIQVLKKEEERLNRVIQEKDQDRLLRSLQSENKTREIEKKEEEIFALSQTKQLLENSALEIIQCFEELEEKSFLWKLFYSERFRQLPLKEKTSAIKKCKSERRNISRKLNNILVVLKKLIGG